MKHLSPSGQENFDAVVAMAILATVAVVMRFSITIRLKKRPLLADWLCASSLCLFWVYTVLLLDYITYVGRKEQGSLELVTMKSAASRARYIKIVYVIEFIMTFVITTAKLSILSFYYQIFAISARFRRAVIVTAGICVIWSVVVLFLVGFQCRPISAFWNTTASWKYCMHTAAVYLGYETSNLFIDVLILCLPIGMVRGLKLAKMRRISVYLIFLSGGFVCISSMIRLRYIWIPPNYYMKIDTSKTMVWLTVQLGMAIICSCLPTYGPLYSILSGRSITSAFRQPDPVSPAKKISNDGVHKGAGGQDSVIADNFAFRIPSQA